MKRTCLLLVGIYLQISLTGALAKQALTPPKYDEAVLKTQFYEFMEKIDPLVISKNYPGAVRKLLSSHPENQRVALKTLAGTGEIEVIPWLLPFLDSEDRGVRIRTGASLDKVISSYVLKRRDRTRLDEILIRPLRTGEKDLRPLAWIVLKMFRKPDDGSTHGYATSMTRYLGLHEFETELEQCLESKHPAVVNHAKWALESLKRQREYEKEISNNAMDSDKK